MGFKMGPRDLALAESGSRAWPLVNTDRQQESAEGGQRVVLLEIHAIQLCNVFPLKRNVGEIVVVCQSVTASGEPVAGQERWRWGVPEEMTGGV